MKNLVGYQVPTPCCTHHLPCYGRGSTKASYGRCHTRDDEGVGITTLTHLLVTAEALNFTTMRNQPMVVTYSGKETYASHIYMEEIAGVTTGPNQLLSHQSSCSWLQLITTTQTTSTTSCSRSLPTAVATSCNQNRININTPNLTWKTPKSG